MSATLGDGVAVVRVHLKDFDTSDPIFPTDFLRSKFDNVMRNVVATKLRLGQTYTPAAIAIDPSTNRYKLPGSPANYANVRQAHLASLGWEIDILPIEALQSDWYGIIDPSRVKGDPLRLALYEDADQSVWAWLYPWPRKADTIDLMASVLPAAATDDAGVYGVDDAAFAAAAYQTAAEIIAGASTNNLVSLNLNPQSAQLYIALAKDCIRDSRLRHARLRGAGHVRRTRRK